jgi:enamine deaminase RidA (YjgF/YER057c/UK114 family)
MNFIGGDRFFIEPVHSELSIFEQISDCFNQVNNRANVVYKLNFFVRTSSYEDYKSIQNYVSSLVHALFVHRPVLLNVIAQPPFEQDVILEVFTYNPDWWQIQEYGDEFGRALGFRRGDSSFLFGQSQANSNRTCQEQSTLAFEAMMRLLQQTGFPLGSVIRQWNYIENILLVENGLQHYQVFNDVRSAFYGDAFLENGYPAATGIGMNRGGVIIEFIAMLSDKAVSVPVDNPNQVAAYRYSENVLVGKKGIKTTPKFERARFLKTEGVRHIFISGTAAITGEKSVAEHDASEQAGQTISNIRRLYSSGILASLGIGAHVAKPHHLRVYVKNPSDFRCVREVCRAEFPGVGAAFIQADICRENLLVEIEGEVEL